MRLPPAPLLLGALQRRGSPVRASRPAESLKPGVVGVVGVRARSGRSVVVDFRRRGAPGVRASEATKVRAASEATKVACTTPPSSTVQQLGSIERSQLIIRYAKPQISDQSRRASVRVALCFDDAGDRAPAA